MDMTVGKAHFGKKESPSHTEKRVSFFVNCYKGKGNALVRGNRKGRKFTYQILTVVGRVIE